MKNDNNFDFSGETEGNIEQILNDINYCCTKCLSLINILSIKENKNIILLFLNIFMRVNR